MGQQVFLFFNLTLHKYNYPVPPAKSTDFLWFQNIHTNLIVSQNLPNFKKKKIQNDRNLSVNCIKKCVLGLISYYLDSQMMENLNTSAPTWVVTWEGHEARIK